MLIFCFEVSAVRTGHKALHDREEIQQCRAEIVRQGVKLMLETSKYLLHKDIEVKQ